MSNLQITIWDVEHGTAIYAVTPNGRKIILDCGSSSDFSPALEINPTNEKKILDHLVISHPHQDHITDIQNIDEKFQIKTLQRNEKITEEVMKEDNPSVFDPPNASLIDKYYELGKRFSAPVKWDNDPENPEWGKNCTFHTFANCDSSLGPNNLSTVTFIEFGEDCVLCGGDVEEKGWLELLKSNKFVTHLEKTTIFIASHHGNDSGYCKDLFDHFTPKIIIFSAGSGHIDDNSRTRYANQTQEGGMSIRNQSGDEENRSVLTTRHDGHIHVVVYPSGSKEPKISLRSSKQVTASY